MSLGAGGLFSQVWKELTQSPQAGYRRKGFADMDRWNPSKQESVTGCGTARGQPP